MYLPTNDAVSPTPARVHELTPVIYDVPTDDSVRPCAAFRLTFQIQLTANDSNVAIDLVTCLGDFFETLIASNRFPEDPSGGRYLETCGIPSTFAHNFTELKAFFGNQGKMDIHEVSFKQGGVVNLVAKAPLQASAPTKMTLHFGPRPFERALFGNYRELRAHFNYTSQPIVESVLNVDKAVFTIAAPRILSSELEFDSASFMMEFIVPDMRRRISF